MLYASPSTASSAALVTPPTGPRSSSASRTSKTGEARGTGAGRRSRPGLEVEISASIATSSSINLSIYSCLSVVRKRKW